VLHFFAVLVFVAPFVQLFHIRNRINLDRAAHWTITSDEHANAARIALSAGSVDELGCATSRSKHELERIHMKSIIPIVGIVALTWAGMVLAQEQSPSVAGEEKTSATIETKTPRATAPPATPANAATAEQGEAVKKEAATAAKKEQPAPSPSAAPTMKKMKPQAALKDAENRWATGIGSHDSASVESLIARDFIGVNLKGKIQNRRGLLSEMKTDKDKYTSSTNEKLEVNTYGPAVGVVVGTYRGKGTDKDGKAFDRSIRFTDTWMERDGQWQCIASQIMLLSPK
jgi:ketosteroid isomerase-like protein